MLPRVLTSVLTYRLTPTIRKEPEGYATPCSELGVTNTGDYPSDALLNLEEATDLYLENVVSTDELIPMKQLL